MKKSELRKIIREVIKEIHEVEKDEKMADNGQPMGDCLVNAIFAFMMINGIDGSSNPDDAVATIEQAMCFCDSSTCEGSDSGGLPDISNYPPPSAQTTNLARKLAGRAMQQMGIKNTRKMMREEVTDTDLNQAGLGGLDEGMKCIVMCTINHMDSSIDPDIFDSVEHCCCSCQHDCCESNWDSLGDFYAGQDDLNLPDKGKRTLGTGLNTQRFVNNVSNLINQVRRRRPRPTTN